MKALNNQIGLVYDKGFEAGRVAKLIRSGKNVILLGDTLKDVEDKYIKAMSIVIGSRIKNIRKLSQKEYKKIRNPKNGELLMFPKNADFLKDVDPVQGAIAIYKRDYPYENIVHICEI